jgi:hypothetical protein
MENPENRVEKALPQTLFPWVLTPVMGEFGVMVEGGCHFFFSDQGPLLKGGGDVGGEYPQSRNTPQVFTANCALPFI